MPSTKVRGTHKKVEPATLPSERPESAVRFGRALYVTGPRGGARYLLPEGTTHVGRDADCAVAIDDPRVSRVHAALELELEAMHLCDLGSANGTFVGGKRLAAHETSRLELDQVFFLGDSRLVVHAIPLERAADKRMPDLDRLRAGIAALQAAKPDTGLLVVRARAHRPAQSAMLEAVLGDLVQRSAEWMFRCGAEQLLFARRATGSDTPPLERTALERLASFGVTADVDARVFSAAELGRMDASLSPLLTGGSSVTLERGTVVLLDPAMLELRRSAQRVAPVDVNVLVLGETGTGKDVIASMVHELSPRATKPFVRLNCASLPEPLLESELFGHERGAFTSAVASKPGLLEAADGGTVFLDEVGDLPLPLQAKLLRVIESREVTRIGSVRPRTVDVRFVAATNHDLAAAVEAQKFRSDLYYRLNTITLSVPPLRARPSEIEPLARLFLENACARFEVGPRRLSEATLAALSAHPWPGNVRELRNVIERAVLLTEGPLLEPEVLALRRPDATSATRAPNAVPQAMLTPEHERIVTVLAECGGNQSRAAEILGISRRQLVRLVARLGLPRPRGDRAGA